MPTPTQEVANMRLLKPAIPTGFVGSATVDSGEGHSDAFCSSRFVLPIPRPVPADLVNGQTSTFITCEGPEVLPLRSDEVRDVLRVIDEKLRFIMRHVLADEVLVLTLLQKLGRLVCQREPSHGALRRTASKKTCYFGLVAVRVKFRLAH